MKKMLLSILFIAVFSIAAIAQQDAGKLQPVVTKQKVEQDERVAIQERLNDEQKRKAEQNKQEARREEAIAATTKKSSTQTGKQ